MIVVKIKKIQLNISGIMPAMPEKQGHGMGCEYHNTQ